MNDGNWIDITANVASLPGPKAFLVSGYGAEQIATLRRFMDDLEYPDVPLKACTKRHIKESSVEQALLSEDNDEAPLEEGALPYALLLSGLTIHDVQKIMTSFSRNGLPRPIFATTTDNNLKLTVGDLLRHLLEEQKLAR